jgi:hypothetical protein
MELKRSVGDRIVRVTTALFKQPGKIYMGCFIMTHNPGAKIEEAATDSQYENSKKQDGFPIQSNYILYGFIQPRRFAFRAGVVDIV